MLITIAVAIAPTVAPIRPIAPIQDVLLARVAIAVTVLPLSICVVRTACWYLCGLC